MSSWMGVPNALGGAPSTPTVRGAYPAATAPAPATTNNTTTTTAGGEAAIATFQSHSQPFQVNAASSDLNLMAAVDNLNQSQPQRQLQEPQPPSQQLLQQLQQHLMQQQQLQQDFEKQLQQDLEKHLQQDLEQQPQQLQELQLQPQLGQLQQQLQLLQEPPPQPGQQGQQERRVSTSFLSTTARTTTAPPVATTGFPGYASVSDNDIGNVYAFLFSPEMTTPATALATTAASTTSSASLPTGPAQQQQKQQASGGCGDADVMNPALTTVSPTPLPPPEPPIERPFASPVTSSEKVQVMMHPALPVVSPEILSPSTHPHPRPAALTAASETTEITAELSTRNFVAKKKGHHQKSHAATAAAGAGSVMPRACVSRKKRVWTPSSSSSVLTLSLHRSRATEENSGGGRRKALKLSRESSAPRSQYKSPKSPHTYLIAILSSRGYSTSIHPATSCGYLSPPTPLQLASHGMAVHQAVQKGDILNLGRLLKCGLSPNPTNKFSESVLAMSARRGDADVFRCQINAGADVSVCDQSGKTPLHHAAWSAGGAGWKKKPGVSSSSMFEIVEQILDMDADMVRVADNGGRSPLEYVSGDRWDEWIEFLERVKDRYWPLGRNSPGCGDLNVVPRPPRGAGIPVPDPENALPLEVAAMVASGQVKPEAARDCIVVEGVTVESAGLPPPP